MRELVMDTETTGLDPADGHRIVEIGAVELINHIPTGRTYHQYVNPERDMPIEAFNVHGLSQEFLSDKPVFSQIVEDFVAFVSDGTLVIHNAGFDMRFLNAEMSAAGFDLIPDEQVIDSLAIARKKFPMGPNSLDALCKRFGVNNSMREKHGALLDSELLAEVYLELIGGRQTALSLVAEVNERQSPLNTRKKTLQRPHVLPDRLSQAERDAHTEAVASLGEGAIWARYS